MRNRFGVAMILLSCSVSAKASPERELSGQAIATSGHSEIGTTGWIGYPGEDMRPRVYQFRRIVDIASTPRRFPVRVSADNAFTLYVNGRRVLNGPSTSDRAHWRYSFVDLAPYLVPGGNIISVTVWNFVKTPLPAIATDDRQRAWASEMLSQTGRMAQQSIATGLWLEGDDAASSVSTSKRGWQVAIDPSHVPVAGATQVGLARYYVAGAPERVDTRLSLPLERGADYVTRSRRSRGNVQMPAGPWFDAVSAPQAARPLMADILPAQKYASRDSGKVVEFEGVVPGFPVKPVVVPAHSKARLLLQRDAMISAYPELQIDGGQNAHIKLTYAEAPYEADGSKGDRNAFAGKQFIGIHDDIIASGRRENVIPLWWRTWRYLEVNVETDKSPLTLTGLKTWETGYPFEEKAYFRSDDPELDRIWQVGWQTALVDAHDTYMDSAYWEQLQYIGDTRLQMLISYAVSGDSRLARQAIDAFASSNVDNGLLEGAWPSRGTNSIAPFSLLWVGMLHDWMMQQPDTAVIDRNLQRMRIILGWFAAWKSKDGLLVRNPQWNFIDWVGQDATDRTRFPSYGTRNESCLTSVMYLGALRQAGEIERSRGDSEQGSIYDLEAQHMGDALRRQCYDPGRGLFADNPDRNIFSQQMNALAVLYDVASPGEAGKILERITKTGKGIDAPDGMYQSSYYFAWYLARAFDHAGLSGRYTELLQTWRDLLKQNFTTWPEERGGHTRSDSHAWSAHPTADLLQIVAGIGPDATGYDRLRIAPSLGKLKRLEAAAMTPAGQVRVSYRIVGDRLYAKVDKPADLAGSLVWETKAFALKGSHQEFSLKVSNSISAPR